MLYKVTYYRAISSKLAVQVALDFYTKQDLHFND